MVPSFALMFTLDLMVVLKALALSPSNLLMMLVTPFSSSTATTGRAVLLKCVKIASLALDLGSVGVVSALTEALAEGSVLMVALAVAVCSMVVLEEVMVVSEVATAEQVLLMEASSLLLPIPLQTMPLPVLREARPFTFAT
jgi:sialic acid synthase SpsE